MQQLPDSEKTESKNEISCLKWRIYNGRRKVRVNYQTDTDELNTVVNRYRNNLYLKNSENELKRHNTINVFLNEFISWAFLTFLSRVALSWMKLLFSNEINFLKNGCPLLISTFRLYLGVQLSFEHIFARKVFFKCMLHVSVGILDFFIREMDQKCNFGWIINYGDTYLEFLFRQFKVFRLHSILEDTAGAVRAHSRKGPGYCYIIGRWPN